MKLLTHDWLYLLPHNSVYSWAIAVAFQFPTTNLLLNLFHLTSLVHQQWSRYKKLHYHEFHDFQSTAAVDDYRSYRFSWEAPASQELFPVFSLSCVLIRWTSLQDCSVGRTKQATSKTSHLNNHPSLCFVPLQAHVECNLGKQRLLL